MARQHAIAVSAAPRWILLIRLNLIGTEIKNSKQGAQATKFRNPNLVYGVDGVVEMEAVPDGIAPVPIINPALNRDYVLSQDRRRRALVAEINRLNHLYDIRNLSDPEDERLYAVLQQVIFNPNFFEPGIARILHTVDHPLHVRTMVAVYGLIGLSADQEKKNRGGTYGSPPKAAMPRLDDKPHVFNILVFDRAQDFHTAAGQKAVSNPH